MKSSSSVTSTVLTPELLDQIADFWAMEAVFFGINHAEKDGKTRRGGYICIFDVNGDQKLLKLVGEPDSLRKNVFRSNALNKCQGMFDRRADITCVSSWCFRDPQAEPPRYGGGIKLSNGAFMAFSGFPEDVDEAVCLFAANHFGLIDAKRVDEILAVSNNNTEFASHVRLLMTP
jgi:hypothetical protein